MNKSLNFENYLFISPEKFIILIKEESTNEKILSKQILINEKSSRINYEILDTFLASNIFNIEKEIKRFIKKFHLIIDSNDFLTTQISIKRKNYKNILSKEELIYSLNEVKDACKKTLENKKIIHMIIEKYIIDNNEYLVLPKNLECDNFSLDVKFISLSQKIVKNLETILKKYQISIDRIINVDYVYQFFAQDEHELFASTQKLIDGYNENEIQFVTKNKKNIGFFEKFFRLFG